MFGNLLNNVLIQKLVDSKQILIQPWDKNKLQVAQYPIHVREIIYEKGSSKYRHHLFETNAPYIFTPNEYALIVINERIVLEEGIVGRFIIASNMIEKGFGLTVGKLDPLYGKGNEEIRFGIKNYLNKENILDQHMQIAYIEFYDLRGLPALPSQANDYIEYIKTLRIKE